MRLRCYVIHVRATYNTVEIWNLPLLSRHSSSTVRRLSWRTYGLHQACYWSCSRLRSPPIKFADEELRPVPSFYDEVIRQDPRFQSLTRITDVSLLEPVTSRIVQAIIDDARALGIEVMIF